MSRLAVLISGSGTNLQALIDASGDGRLDAQVAVVVSNKSRAYGLARARAAGIETLVFTAKGYRGQPGWRERYDAELAAKLLPHRPDLVVLAGWMHILSPSFLEQFPDRVINLHPALPGQFAGTHAIDRAFEAFRRGEISQTGIMVHWVVPAVDAGPVLASTAVPIRTEDTLEELEARIHEQEHRLIIEAVTKALAQR